MMNIGELCQFKFAGEILKGKFIDTHVLEDNTKLYIFKDKKGYKYPIRKENICGNLKQ